MLFRIGWPGVSGLVVSSALIAIFFALPRESAAATQILPQSPEFQVNTYTQFAQLRPVIAADSAGNFVVVWHQTDSLGTPTEIMGRRFTSGGAPASGEFQVNTYTSGSQFRPWVARNPSGAFVVVWTSDGQDGAGYGVFGRRYDAAGNPLATEFQVNTYTGEAQHRASVAIGSGGDFVVAWQSYGQDGDDYGIFARRFDASGTAVGVEFRVNDYVTSFQSVPTVALKGDGSFIVTWSSGTQDGDGAGAFARRFDSGGSPLGVEFQINAYTTGDQHGPSLAYSPNEGFAVVWQSDGQDGSDAGLFARGFGDDGTPQPGETQINTYTVGAQAQPTLLAVGPRNFVVVWQSYLQDGSDYGLFARTADEHDTFSDEVRLNATTPLAQFFPRAATTGQRFMVVWQSLAQDGSGSGVFGRRFVVPITLDVDGDGMIQALTDGLLILRYDFGFRGSTLITGAVGAACSRCDAPSIEAYLGSV
jgi:hypothetical protein